MILELIVSSEVIYTTEATGIPKDTVMTLVQVLFVFSPCNEGDWTECTFAVIVIWTLFDKMLLQCVSIVQLNPTSWAMNHRDSDIERHQIFVQRLMVSQELFGCFKPLSWLTNCTKISVPAPRIIAFLDGAVFFSMFRDTFLGSAFKLFA